MNRWVNRYRSFFSLLLLLLLFPGKPALAQKENLTFVDRTGIKGLQLSFGTRQLANYPEWNHVFRKFVSVTEIPDSVSFQPAHKDLQKTRAVVQVQVVYAPFRFSHHTLLRNFELSMGLNYRRMHHKYLEERHSPGNPSYYYQERNIYDMNLSNTTLFTKGIVNYPIAGSLMGYGSIGFGMNIAGALDIDRTEYSYRVLESQTSQHGTYYQLSQEYSDSRKENLYSAQRVTYQTASLGLKVYLTCRLNLNLEYQLDYFRFRSNHAVKLYQLQHGLQFGLRFKFNPPEPLSEEEKKKDADRPFW